MLTILLSRSLYLGGKPQWEFSLIDRKESIDEILSDHFEREKYAVQLYSDIIKFIDKEGEGQLKVILKGILSEEGEHLRTIKGLMERVKQDT